MAAVGRLTLHDQVPYFGVIGNTHGGLRCETDLPRHRPRGFCVVVMTVPLFAHPRGELRYDKGSDAERPVTEWIWANPHCFLKFDAKDDTGTVETWGLRNAESNRHDERGWARNSFKPGDDVTVTLQAVRSGAPVGRIKALPLPTVRRWGRGLPLPLLLLPHPRSSSSRLTTYL